MITWLGTGRTTPFVLQSNSAGIGSEFINLIIEIKIKKYNILIKCKLESINILISNKQKEKLNSFIKNWMNLSFAFNLYLLYL